MHSAYERMLEDKITFCGNNLLGSGIDQLEQEIKKSKTLILQGHKTPDVEQGLKRHS